MKMNEIIRAKRGERGLTQEQVATRLGVSASAVYKWEKGTSYPDITLLPVLARLLGVDLNTLLSFQADLTPEEVGRFCEEIVQVIREQGIEAGFQLAMDQIREYPASGLLLCNTAGTLDGALILFAPERRAQYEPEIEALYRRASLSETAQIRDQANYMLVTKYMNRSDFEQAQALLDEFPDAVFDKRTMQATLYRRQGRRADAAELLEKKLLAAANDCYAALLSLMELAQAEQNGALADTLCEAAQQTVRLFDLWEYSACAAPFQLAVERQDAKQCVAILRKMIPAIKKQWTLSASPLYRHIKEKPNAGVLQEQMLEGIFTALKTDEELCFLQGDPAFEELMKSFQQEG